MKNFNTNTENNEVWLTPLNIIESLGVFDLDPCSPINRPWNTAKNHLTIEDESLLHNWEGRVWLNPPYGKYMEKFMEKMALHNNGIALIYARTDTKALHKYMFPFAESILFIEGRIKFCYPDGTQSKTAGNAPSILIGYNEYNSEMIDKSKIKGHHIYLKQKIFISGISYEKDKT